MINSAGTIVGASDTSLATSGPTVPPGDRLIADIDAAAAHNQWGLLPNGNLYKAFARDDGAIINLGALPGPAAAPRSGSMRGLRLQEPPKMAQMSYLFL